MAPDKKYKGVIVPMICPLREDKTIDRTGTERIINSFLEAGVSPFVLGTTGEASSIPSKQKEILVKETVKHVRGKTITYAGISSDCLANSVETGKKFADIGVDVLVTTLPSYYPLKESNMLRYCEELADACPLPLILYNIPGTTGFSVPLDVIEKLSHHPNIAGLKDSERDQARLEKSIDRWKDRADFSHLTGWAAMSAFALRQGSDGIVPSTGNFAPAVYRNLYQAVLKGETDKAEKMQAKTDKLSSLYQKGRNLSESLAALKIIMSVKGLCGTQMLPPIYRMDKKAETEYKKHVQAELEKIDY